MNRLSDDERALGLDVSASMPGRWYAEEVVEAIVAARLASVKALVRALADELDAECGAMSHLYDLLDQAHAAVLGSDAHTEQKGAGE